MRNPPNFVVYIVLIKVSGSDKFDPAWGEWVDSKDGRYAKAFARKEDARRECGLLRIRFGTKNAYVQQYGPYK